MKLRTIIAALLAGVAMFAACEPTVIITNPTPENDYLMLLSDEVMKFPAEGGTDTILYIFIPEEEVKQHTRTSTLDVATEATWIELTDNHNDSTIDMRVAANEGEARTATVVLTYNAQSITITIEQEGHKPEPPQPEEVTFNADSFYGLYHGNKYSPDMGNYFVYLSDLGLDDEGVARDGGTYYLLDLYAPLHEGEGDVCLPAGTYSLDNSGSYAAWSIGATYTMHYIYSAAGDTATHSFEAATLTVTAEGLTLTARIDGVEHTVTYSGDMTLINKTIPEPEEIEVVESEVKHAWSYYFGDMNTPDISDYFTLILSNEELNTDGTLCYPGAYYRFELYSVLVNTEAGLTLPHGTYIIDSTNSCTPNTISVHNSMYITYDTAGELETMLVPSSGTLVVDENGITAEVMYGGKLHKVSFKGDITIYNNSRDDNHERYSTLTDDIVFDIDDATIIMEYYGDYYSNGTDNWMVHIFENPELISGTYLLLDILSDPAADNIAGTYSADKEYGLYTFIPGYIEWGNNFYSSWYVDMVDGGIGEIYAPFSEGSVTIDIEGDRYTFTLNTHDDRGHSLTGTISGSPMSEYTRSHYALITK